MKRPKLRLLVPHAAEDNASLGLNEDRDQNELLVTIGHHVLKPREEPNGQQDLLAKTVSIAKQLAIVRNDSLVPKERQDLLALKVNRDKLVRKMQTRIDLVDQNEATGHREQIDLSELLVQMFQIEGNAQPALKVSEAKELLDLRDLLEAKRATDLLAANDRSVPPHRASNAPIEMLHLTDGPPPPVRQRNRVASGLGFMTMTALLSSMSRSNRMTTLIL